MHSLDDELQHRKIAIQCLTKIAELETMIKDQTENEDNFFEPTLSNEQIRIVLYNQKIRAAIANYRNNIESLGLKKFKIEKSWIERLDPQEKEIFSRIYYKKQKQETISSELGLKQDEIRVFFDRCIEKIIKALESTPK